MVKKPNRFAEEISRSMAVKKTEARKRDKKLYDVEVEEVDKVNKRIKIHFVGYSTQFDEWRFFGGDEGPESFPFIRRERLFTPTDRSVEDREQVFLGLLYREIKKKLWSGRREDPDVNIDLSIDQDVVMMGLGRVTPSRKERGREPEKCKPIYFDNIFKNLTCLSRT